MNVTAYKDDTGDFVLADETEEGVAFVGVVAPVIGFGGAHGGVPDHTGHQGLDGGIGGFEGAAEPGVLFGTQKGGFGLVGRARFRGGIPAGVKHKGFDGAAAEARVDAVLLAVAEGGVRAVFHEGLSGVLFAFDIAVGVVAAKIVVVPGADDWGAAGDGGERGERVEVDVALALDLKIRRVDVGRVADAEEHIDGAGRDGVEAGGGDLVLPGTGDEGQGDWVGALGLGRGAGELAFGCVLDVEGVSVEGVGLQALKGDG